MSDSHASSFRGGTAWLALRYFSLYRLVLSGFLLTLILTDHLPNPFGSHIPVLFNFSVFIYLMLAAVLSFLVESQWLSFRQQVFVQILVDFTAFGVMIYTSGGVGSGIGLLLVMSVAAGSLLLMGRTAYLFAAIGTLVILLVESLLLTRSDYSTNFTQAGLLGAVLFATAFLAHTLARRIRESEALAAKRGEDLVSLARLNERIVQRMRSGVMVMDNRGMIRLANLSATSMLGSKGTLDGKSLMSLSRELSDHMQLWMRGEQATRLLRPSSRTTDIQVSFTHLGPETDSDILAFLEDAATLRQKAQQLKLASLGQLTASIAHEIRNPLGAISHAGQLLSESPALGSSDQRLLQIIREHSSRVNQIIENILKLGRRDDSVPESLLLKPWLEKFVADFKLQHDLSGKDIVISVEPSDLRATMDQSQLHQIVTNLCENALRYSVRDPKIELRCTVKNPTDRPCLDIIDTGTGIVETQADQIFEPFFTDRSGGTGLGLYIANELCEANQAVLSLHRNTKTGCCFRIIFAHPGKQIHTDWVIE